jgi:hypothetical protein
VVGKKLALLDQREFGLPAPLNYGAGAHRNFNDFAVWGVLIDAPDR